MTAPSPVRQGGGPPGGHGVARPHDSADKHVTGRAVYVDDIPEPDGTLQVWARPAERAHARILRLDLDAVRRAPGVVAVLTAADIPGVNDCSPVAGDDPVLADGCVIFWGQPVFAVAAETIAEARAAAALAVIEYEDLPAILTIDDALAAGSLLGPPRQLVRGDAATAIAAAPHQLSGRIEMGGQDHFYLEGQVSLAVPTEAGEMLVYCSTQHPSEVQHNVAKILGRPDAAVTVEVRRMGGGFGGKETQASQWAGLAALAAALTGRPAKMRLDRDDDMIMTGKRHEFRADWRVGFDGEGRILGLDMALAARCGVSTDLSPAIVDRAIFHVDNAYYLPAVTITARHCRTNTVSNTAFRGFGGPQGMLAIERVMDAIARRLGRDPLDVRRANLYGGDGRDTTPYGQTVEDDHLPAMIDRLEATSRYRERRAEIAVFNRTSPIIKRGIALTPVKFGISFTTTHLNQAGALVHLYTDGSIHLNHGGTEMGQGLFVKVAQIVAEVFGVGPEAVRVTATSTGKVPNTSATAASSGTDLNGMAARTAALAIRERLARCAAEAHQADPDEVVFADGMVTVRGNSQPFAKVVKDAYLARIPLSATGFYKTPKLAYDARTMTGRPFYYFAWGAAVSEVAIDTLTGETRLLAVDILHDVGRSLNPAIDRGQIEGGFIQGMGWLTSEELWWDAAGRLRTHAPSTYKIPTARDRPAAFRIDLLENRPNREETVSRSKAVGEPPFMLAISVFSAITDAVAALGEGPALPPLDAPATPERVLFAVEAVAVRPPPADLCSGA